MSASINSNQKIDGFNAIASGFTLFMVNLAEVSTKIKNDADTIAVPGVSNIATNLLSVIKTANSLCEETATGMVQIVDTWGERQGFGEAAKAAFEECKTTVRAMTNSIFTVGEVEECDGLHENVTDETIAAFKNDIQALLDARYTFIMKISEAKTSYVTEDTVSVYDNIGVGVERFTNGVVDVLETNKSTLNQFGVNLDESINKVKNQSANVASAGESAKAKIGSIEADLD